MAFRGSEDLLSEFSSLIVPLPKSRSLHWLVFLSKEKQFSFRPSIKITYKNTILLASHFHPQSLKKGLPPRQLHHVNWICDSDENYVKYAGEMMKHFRDDSQALYTAAKIKIK